MLSIHQTKFTLKFLKEFRNSEWLGVTKLTPIIIMCYSYSIKTFLKAQRSYLIKERDLEKKGEFG